MKECLSGSIDELASENEGNQQQKEAAFFRVLLCLQKVWPRFRVGLPTSNDPIKKTPYRLRF